MTDFRLKENRREAFIRWYAWSVFYHDCDPAVWMTQYLNNRFEHNSEQRYWLCWLYANTYQLPSAWVLLNEFPDFELATVDRITQWNTQNYKRLRYQTDTKWNKGHLPVMFQSYQEFFINKSGLQEKMFKALLQDNEHTSFNFLWREINERLHKFGRYSTWFYLQHLKHTCDLQIEPTSLMLNDYAGSRSHRNGLLYALGAEDRIDEKLTTGGYMTLEAEAADILAETRRRYSQLEGELDYFTMETCLCSFKKIFRTRHGRYLGYYLDRQAEEILQAEKDGWDGIEWNVLWQARDQVLDNKLKNKKGIEDILFSIFLDSGTLHRSNWLTGEPDKETGGLGDFWS